MGASGGGTEGIKTIKDKIRQNKTIAFLAFPLQATGGENVIQAKEAAFFRFVIFSACFINLCRDFLSTAGLPPMPHQDATCKEALNGAALEWHLKVSLQLVTAILPEQSQELQLLMVMCKS